MTLSEAAALKAALNRLASGFQSTANIQIYFRRWLADVDANYDGLENTTTDTTGDTPVGLIASTVALLPGTPNTGDEAIVTDALTPAVGSTVVGGGAVRVMVTWNGSNWVVE